MTDDSDVIAALTALRDAGLVTDPAELNRAWAELTGRATTRQEPSGGTR